MSEAINSRLMTRTEAKKYLRGVDPYQVCPPLAFGDVKRWDRSAIDFAMEDPPGAPKEWGVTGLTLADACADPALAGGESIYFIQGEATGLIKIGYSRNLLTRFGQLQTASADVLRLLLRSPGDQQHERELHGRFAPWRRHGEWFEPAKPLLRHIADHQRPA